MSDIDIEDFYPEEWEAAGPLNPALTVRQLRIILAQPWDESLPVELEGCDCFGPAHRVVQFQPKDTKPARLVIRRPPGQGLSSVKDDGHSKWK